MCKLMVFTNLTKVKKIKKLTETIAVLVGETEQDGYGYALQGTKNVFGERTTLNPQEFEVQLDKELFEANWVKHDFNRFGVKDKVNGAGMFHGRTSTNTKNLKNTHPIIKNDWTLIHNGVVSNHGPKYEMITDNDTEHLVHYMSTTGISGIEQHITGYYAIAAFDPRGQLHIIKDAVASLYVASISEIDSLVFATKRDHINQVCIEMGWKPSIITEMVDNKHLIFKDNKVVHEASIKPRGRTAYEDGLSEKSLGYDLNQLTQRDFKSYDSIHKYVDERTEDEIAFLEEIKEYGDASYKIFNYRGDEVQWEEFIKFEDDDMLMCTVVRPDGTSFDSADYFTERLFEGRIA